MVICNKYFIIGGVLRVKAKKWVFLFWTTLVVGAISGTITGFALDWNNGMKLGVKEFIVTFIWLFGVSAMFSVVSQMGFFAYLSLHRIGIGIFRSWWNGVQVILIALILFDLVYFRYQFFAEEGESIVPYLLVSVFLFVTSLMVAYIKQKETTKEAFVPALFLMIVVTTLEWFPALYINDPKWLWVYFVPLFTSNVWQLLILHRLLDPKVIEESAKKQAKKQAGNQISTHPQKKQPTNRKKKKRS